MDFPLNSISKVSKNNWSFIVNCNSLSGMLFELSKCTLVMHIDILLPLFYFLLPQCNLCHRVMNYYVSEKVFLFGTH